MPRCLSVVFLTLILLPGIYAQEFRGTVTGRVVDVQSAAVPNAKIIAVLVATGAQSVTNTGLDGQFTIPFLSPGTYRVEADAAYGHTGGGTANVVMKGGTNAIHGSLYEFNQVSKLQATNFFTN